LHLQLIIFSRSLQRFFERRVTVDGFWRRCCLEVECKLSLFGCAYLSWGRLGWSFRFIVKDPVCFEVDDLDFDLPVCRMRDQKFVDDAVENAQTPSQTKAELAPETILPRGTR